MVFDQLRKRMKVVFIAIVVTFAASLLYVGGAGLFGGGLQGGGPAQAAPVARVDNVEIPWSEFQSAVASHVNYLQAFGQNVRGMGVERVRYQTLQALIGRALLVAEAKRRKIPVSNQEVDAAIGEIRDRFPDEVAFRRALQQNGLTERTLREEVQHDLLLQGLQRQVLRDVPVSEEEIARAYEQVRARHILIRPQGEGEAGWEKAKAEAEKLADRLKKGADFAALAREHSKDPGSAQQGGDLGFIRRGMMVGPFEEAAFSLKPGEVSAPVRTEFGYHIIQVTERREARGEEFERAKEEIRTALQQEKGQDRWADFVRELRSRARVEILDNQLRARTLLEEGKYQEAVAAYQAAIEERPEDPYLRVALAQAYRRLEQDDKASAALEKAAELAPRDIDVLLALGEWYQATGKKEEAVAAYSRASDAEPGNLGLHMLLAERFKELGRADKAAAEEAKVKSIQKGPAGGSGEGAGQKAEPEAGTNSPAKEPAPGT